MQYQALEILTEEPSMDYFLRGLLPRILPEGYRLDENCFIRPHEGKRDLMLSIPKKMRAYSRYGYPVKVLIVHDQDSNDCTELKNALLAQAKIAENAVPSLVRIACRELENWYLGDLEALQLIYPDIKAHELRRKAKFRSPDHVFGAHEIGLLVRDFSKTGAARAMGPIIRLDGNNSPSFRQLVSGVHKLIGW